MKTLFKLTLLIKKGDRIHSNGPFILTTHDDRVIDNLDDAKKLAAFICSNHLQYHGGDTIEYIIDKGTEQEVFKGKCP